MVGAKKDDRASHDAHLSDDETVAKMGTGFVVRYGCAGSFHPTLPTPPAKLAGTPIRSSAKDGAPELLWLFEKSKDGAPGSLD
jgi:hypothetical protein